jgi:anti-sigma regulatory factor (Ser/Thr protein kinase)
MSDEVHIEVERDADIVPARAGGRALASQLGFSRTDATLIATAISEVARNIVVHAGSGEIVVRREDGIDRYGLIVEARDSGPGIADVEAAMEEGYGTKGGLGLGLPGTRRIMDEFEIESEVGRGTTVTMRKWRVRDELERLRDNRDGKG